MFASSNFPLTPTLSPLGRGSKAGAFFTSPQRGEVGSGEAGCRVRGRLDLGKPDRC